MDSAATLSSLGILIYQFLFTLPLFAMVYPLRVLPLLIIGIAMQVLNLRGLCFDEQVERTSRMWARPLVNLLIYVAAVPLGACHTLLFLFNPFHVALEHVAFSIADLLSCGRLAARLPSPTPIDRLTLSRRRPSTMPHNARRRADNDPHRPSIG